MHLLLDSGAFSAWNAGAAVDIDDYIRFIKENAEHVAAYVNLDVIPGAPGVTPNAEQVEASAAQGWANMIYMEEHGLKPMPVFHQGERFAWLEKMVAHGCSYIGISPANDRSTAQKVLWLDRVFDTLCDAGGVPCVNTHSFGATSTVIIFRYPWYSVDSTTWLATGSRFGMILVPKLRADGSWEFSQKISRVFVSKEANPSRPGHINGLTGAEQATVKRFVEQCGSTLDEVRDDRHARNMVNAMFFKLLSEQNLNIRFKRRRESFLFDSL
jgi:hypothetical protein